jgi:hypothetical protein
VPYLQVSPVSTTVRSQGERFAEGESMEDQRWKQMEERRRSRQELRAILANPESTQEQVIQAKLTLSRRIAEGSAAVRQVCVEYDLSPEPSCAIMAGHQLRMGTFEDQARDSIQHLEQLLIRLRQSPEPEQPAT